MHNFYGYVLTNFKGEIQIRKFINFCTGVEQDSVFNKRDHREVIDIEDTVTGILTINGV